MPTTIVTVRDTCRLHCAAVADLLVLVVFVLIGRRTHGEDAGIGGFVRVLWPFVAGLVLGWAVTVLFREPLAWRRALPAWLVTVVGGMALRVLLEGRDFKLAFMIVALLFVGFGMLGWRAVVHRFGPSNSRNDPEIWAR